MSHNRIDNLRPFSSQQDRDEARKNGRAGGIASGESRRWRKDLRAFLQSYLDMDAPPTIQEKMAQFGVAEEDRTNAMALFIGVFARAMKNGDVKAANCIFEWAGMEPMQEEREEVERLRLELARSQAGAVSAQDVNIREEQTNVIIYKPAKTNVNHVIGGKE